MDWTSNSENTNKILLTKSLLAPYLAANAELYRCPDDNYQSSLQRALNWPPRVRSYSMNGFFGNLVSYASNGRNPYFTRYRQWLKLAEVPQPARFFAFIEEHPDSINDGIFFENAEVWIGNWQDIPTSYHAGACSITFADGRVEEHKWLSWTSKIPITYTYNPPVFDAAGRTDFQWLVDRMAVLY
jgi:prepilin-type processing-associated H-X9-DG protein